MLRDSHADLRDIARCADLIERFIAGKSQAEYLDDVLVQAAVERQLTIIGEATN